MVTISAISRPRTLQDDVLLSLVRQGQLMVVSAVYEAFPLSLPMVFWLSRAGGNSPTGSSGVLGRGDPIIGRPTTPDYNQSC